MKKYLFTLAIVCCMTGPMQSQFTIYDTGNSGLSDNFCWYVNVNASNEVWIGTNTMGADRLNVTGWTNYSPPSGIASNYITPIIFDAAGDVWTGSYTSPGGLSRFNGTSWTVYDPTNSGIADDLITSLSIDVGGDIWVGGRFNGVSRFNGTSWTVYNTSNSGLPDNVIYSMECEPAGGNVWIGTALSGLCLFDGTTWTTYNTSNSGIPGNNVYSLKYNAAANQLLVGTSSGLGVFDISSNSWVVYHVANSGIADNYIRGITLSHCTGDIWLATGFGGISTFDGTNWVNYNTSTSNLPTNSVWSIVATQNFGIWASTWGGGIVRIGDCASDLKVCMPFSGDAQDYSGQGNHGTVNGAVGLTSDRFGTPNSAYYFSGGASDNISIANFGSFIPDDELTISMWAESDVQTSTCLFMLDPDNAQDRCVGCAMYTGVGLIWDYGDIFAGGRMTAGQGYDQNWHHYVYMVSKSQNRQEIYLDGVLQNSGPFVMSLMNRNLPLFIGAGTSSMGGGSLRWRGKIDDVCIYNRGLSASEVNTLYYSRTSCCKSQSSGGGGTDGKQTGISATTEKPLVKIYPNPGNGTVIISGIQEGGATLHIINTEGKRVFAREIRHADERIDTQLPAGIYYYTLSGQGIHVSGKLLVDSPETK
jgi:ligand-binding sensor domain-containing protein